MCLSAALGDSSRTGKCAAFASAFHRLETKMPDPTIPELVARLRELHEKAHPLPWLYRGKSDSLHVAPPEPPFSYGAGFLRLTEYDDAEATDEDIDLILEAVNALPAILDALERQGPHLESLTTWRPIDECGELEAGAEYL